MFPDESLVIPPISVNRPAPVPEPPKLITLGPAVAAAGPTKQEVTATTTALRTRRASVARRAGAKNLLGAIGLMLCSLAENPSHSRTSPTRIAHAIASYPGSLGAWSWATALSASQCLG